MIVSGEVGIGDGWK